jgi:hypothetical protein
LQLVRRALLDRLGAGASDEVTRANFAAVTSRGIGALEMLLDDLARDRNRGCSAPARIADGRVTS